MESKPQLNEWTDAKLATLTPEWEPNTVRARARLNSRSPMAMRPRRLRFAAALAAALVLVAMLPATRAVGQRIWDRLFLTGVTVVRVDPDALPWSLNIHIGQKSPVRAETARAAAQAAGFTPMFPQEFGQSPQLAVLGPITASVNLNARQLQEALDKAGASNVRARQEWDGVKLGIEVRPIVIAEYPGSTLMQMQPLTLDAPAGFAMSEFVEVAFRILGLGAGEASQMARQFAEHPTWFLGVPQEDAVQMREVRLDSGPAMLLEDFKEDGGKERTTLIWSIKDRTLILSGDMTPDRAVAIANSVR
ncbi:MAG TPA: hypothetical protein VER03_24280 [Bryobacteraceae bacterium]|nr:hypothetical protein [Bryobacteraceae bacterium]